MGRLTMVTAALVGTAACAGQSSPPSREHEQPAATQTRAAGPGSGDTTFVELQRVERANGRMADGSCHLMDSASPMPAGVPQGAMHEQRVVSIDHRRVGADG